MDPLKILIIEDDQIEAADMQESLEGEGHIVTAIASTMPEVRQALKQQVPDLALVDIRLEGSPYNGIEIAQKLLKPYSLPIIYLTSSTEKPYVEEAQKTRPAAFMFKPFRSKELAVQIELAYFNHEMQSGSEAGAHTSESLFLPTDQGKSHVRVMKKDVVYMLAAGAYVEVHIRTGSEVRGYVFSMHLGYLEQFFPADQFCRLSRSMVVNLDYVERVEKNQLYVSMLDKPIPFPESQHRELLTKLAVIKTP